MRHCARRSGHLGGSDPQEVQVTLSMVNPVPLAMAVLLERPRSLWPANFPKDWWRSCLFETRELGLRVS